MVQVRRLHKKTSKEDLRAFAETFGGVERVNIFYGTNSDKSALALRSVKLRTRALTFPRIKTVKALARASSRWRSLARRQRY